MSAAPTEFISRRKELARSLRDAGHRDAAAALLAIRKPGVALAGANQVARYDPEAVEGLLEAAASVQRGQAAALAGKGPGAAELRSSSAALQQALDRVTKRAARASGSGAGVEATRRLRDLLQAAALGPEETRRALAAGRLTEEPPPIGFGGLTADPGAAPAGPRTRPQKPAPPVKQQSRGELAAAERQSRLRAAARARAGRAEEEAVRAEKQAAGLERRAEAAEVEALRLRQEAKAAKRTALLRRRQAKQASAELKRL